MNTDSIKTKEDYIEFNREARKNGECPLRKYAEMRKKEKNIK